MESQCQHQAHPAISRLADKAGENLNKVVQAVVRQVGNSMTASVVKHRAVRMGQVPTWDAGRSLFFAFQGWPVLQCLPVLEWAYLNQRIWCVLAQTCKFLEFLGHCILWR